MKKKMLSLFLALTMLCSLMVPAFAADAETGEALPITKITNADGIYFDRAQDWVYGIGLNGGDPSNQDLTFHSSQDATINLGPYGSKQVSANGMVTFENVDLSQGGSATVTWGDNKVAAFGLLAFQDAYTAVESISVNGVAGTESITSVGMVSKFVYTSTLAAGTNLADTTVTIVPAKDSAWVYYNGQNHYQVNGVITLNNVDLSKGYQEFTLMDGGVGRDYQVFAQEAAGITVHIGLRTYLARTYAGLDDAPAGFAYDYGAYEGLMDPNDVDQLSNEIEEWDIAAPTLAGGLKPTFAADSYFTMTIPEGSDLQTVMDVLDTYCVDELKLSINGGVTGGSYVSNINGLGEFDCGSASGWMYIVRDAADEEAKMPMVGANNYPLRDGMYIDWIYTCAYGADFGYSIW